jgi:hypothetical protein
MALALARSRFIAKGPQIAVQGEVLLPPSRRAVEGTPQSTSQSTEDLEQPHGGEGDTRQHGSVRCGD